MGWKWGTGWPESSWKKPTSVNRRRKKNRRESRIDSDTMERIERKARGDRAMLWLLKKLEVRKRKFG